MNRSGRWAALGLLLLTASAAAGEAGEVPPCRAGRRDSLLDARSLYSLGLASSHAAMAWRDEALGLPAAALVERHGRAPEGAAEQNEALKRIYAALSEVGFSTSAAKADGTAIVIDPSLGCARHVCGGRTQYFVTPWLEGSRVMLRVSRWDLPEEGSPSRRFTRTADAVEFERAGALAALRKDVAGLRYRGWWCGRPKKS